MYKSSNFITIKNQLPYMLIPCILLSAFLILNSCSDPSSNNKVTFSGKVTLEDTTDFSGVTVSLYAPVELDTALVRINQQYPNIGVQISQETEFDHREHEPLYTTKTEPDGSWEIKADEGEYNIVAEKEGWGWANIYQSSESYNINTNLYPVTILSGVYSDTPLILEANHTYILRGVVTISSSANINFHANSLLIAEDNAEFIIYGAINCPNEEYFYMTSNSLESGSWKGIDIQSGNTVFKNAIINNSLNGLKINENGINIIGVYLQNIKIAGVEIGQGIKDILIENINFIGGLDAVECFNNDSTIIINKNIIMNQTEYGINLNNASPIIENNFISKNNTGINNLFNSDANIKYNQIEYSTEYGIQVGGSNPVIHWNNFNSNKENSIRIPPTGYGGSSQPTINNNNFAGATYEVYIQGNASNPNQYDVDATNNWWGTTKINLVMDMIYDKQDLSTDDPKYNYTGNIIWTPIATQMVINSGINK